MRSWWKHNRKLGMLGNLARSSFTLQSAPGDRGEEQARESVSIRTQGTLPRSDRYS